MGYLVNEVFNYIDIYSIYIMLIMIALIIFLFIETVVTNSKIRKIGKKYDLFMRGKDAESLEDSIMKQIKDITELKIADRKKDKSIKELQENIKLVYQKVGIVKYDAFKEMGGKLSFSLVLLDKHNTGFVMNSMHSREGCYTYIKEVIEGKTFITLGDEEKEALNMAINSDNFMA
ncbi:MAG: DUF4446 family protein [Clostridiales bacterium]|nr:DUF4446 family protein [Clostridiales bacterium]